VSSAPVYQVRLQQSLSGFVRVNLAAIEREQIAGVPLEAVLADIKARVGFPAATLHSLRTSLKRARAARATAAPLPALAAARHASTPPIRSSAAADVRFAAVAKPSFVYSPSAPGHGIHALVGGRTEETP